MSTAHQECREEERDSQLWKCVVVCGALQFGRSAIRVSLKGEVQDSFSFCYWFVQIQHAWNLFVDSIECVHNKMFVCLFFPHFFFENQQRHQHRWNMINKARFYLYLHQRACVCCSWQWGVTFMADMLQHGPRSGGGHSWHIPLSSHTYFTTGEFNTACIYILYVCRVIHRCVILPHPSSTSTTFLHTSMKGILRHLLWVTHIVG